VTLEITQTNPPAGLPYVELTVRDTGIGIAPAHLVHLFVRFYQATPTEASDTQPGTGIGLALVKELTELHGGQVCVSSQLGTGTAFTVQLPQWPIPETTEEAEAAAPTTTVARPPLELLVPDEEELELAGAEESAIPDADMVLVIEDNADVRRFILDTLAPLHYRLLAAPDGLTGVALAQEQIPDLVISDVMMPGLDGYTVCQQLKQDERTSHTPVILLTAKASAQDKLAGLETGADAYLAKPFNPRKLSPQVRNLLALRHRLQARYAGTETTEAAPPPMHTPRPWPTCPPSIRRS